MDVGKQETSNLMRKTSDSKYNKEFENIEDETEEKNEELSRKETRMEFDDLLVFAGEFGLYQVLLFMSTMPFYFYVVFVYYSQLFMTQVSSQHWCWVPELANLSAVARREAAIPRDQSAKYGHSQCTQFVRNWSELQSNDVVWPILPCQHGWEFSDEIPYPTIASELGWVCDKGTYQSTAQSIFFAGTVCGLLAIGWFADRAGRLQAIVLCNLLGCLGGIASIFTTNLLEFSAARFFVGMSFDNCCMLMYLLVLEYTAPKFRTIISTTAFAVFYTLAAVALPWIAKACGHWKTLGLVTSLPMALAILTPFILQESPRWLLSKGRIDDVIKNVETIGRINSKTIPRDVVHRFRDVVTCKYDDSTGTLWELMRRPSLLRVFLLVCVQHALCDVLFDATVRTLGALQGDWFVSFSLVSLMELPGSMVSALVIDRLGRRRLMSSMMILNAAFCLAMAYVPRGTPAIVCAVAARLVNSASYITSLQWSAELLPTPVRATGVSAAHLFAYAVTMLAQYIFYLGIYIEWLPLVVCAIVAVFGAVVSMALPETMGKEMPQTYEEAEELIRSDRRGKTKNSINI